MALNWVHPSFLMESHATTSPLGGIPVTTTSPPTQGVSNISHQIGMSLSVTKPEPLQSSILESSPVASSGPKLSKDTDTFISFREWALQNYGDSGKTKTVTRKKYNRIVSVLAGEEPPTSENSKFRFWVKAKGFRLGPPPPDGQSTDDQVLYVPTRIQVIKLVCVFVLHILNLFNFLAFVSFCSCYLLFYC